MSEHGVPEQPTDQQNETDLSITQQNNTEHRQQPENIRPTENDRTDNISLSSSVTRKRSQLLQIQINFVSSKNSLLKFIRNVPELNQINYKELKRLIIESNVRAEEFTEAFNELEACIQEGEDSLERFVAEYESTVEKLLEFKRSICIRKELLCSEDSHSLISRRSGKSHHSHYSDKEDRQKKAIIDAKVLEMKVQVEQARQEVELSKLQQDQYVRRLSLEKELATAKIILNAETLSLDQLLNNDDQAQDQDQNKPDCSLPPTPLLQPSSSIRPSHDVKHTSLLKSETSNDIKALDKILIRATLPDLKPIVFNGEPINYQKWRSSFRVCFEKKTDDPEELMGFLAEYTTGEAFALIESKLHLPTMENFKKAMVKLEEEFGNPVIICETFVNKLQSWPKIKSNDAKAMRSFANFLENCSESLKGLGYIGKLNDESTIREALELLPWGMRSKFCENIQNIFRDKKRGPTFDYFAEFVRKKAKAMGDPIFGATLPEKKVPTSSSPKYDINKRIRATGNATKANESLANSNSQKASKPTPRCLYCKGHHWLEHCTVLSKKPIADKKEFLQKRNMCSRCTFKGHEPKDCPNTNWKTCGICKQIGHISLFHMDKNSTTLNPTAPVFTQPESIRSTSNTERKPTTNLTSSTTRLTSNTTTTDHNFAHLNLGYIRHRSRPEKLIPAYIYSDTESDSCFIEEEFSKEQGWDGPLISIRLTTMHGQNEITSEKITDLEVLNLKKDEIFSIPSCYTRQNLPIDRQQIPTKNVAESFPYLHKIIPEIPDITDAKIAIMLGRNVPLAVSPREVIPPNGPTSPWAERNGLGWSILCAEKPTSYHCNFITVRGTANNQTDDSLLLIAGNESTQMVSPKDILKVFEQDFNENRPEEKSLSKEDRRFNDMIDKSLKFQDGHYQVDLPFRHNPPYLENNKRIAESALLRLKTRFERDELFRQDYTTFMQSTIDEGHIERIIEENIGDKPVHYLTHHGVRHKRKGKLRVVFNASLKYHGYSLNDELYQGPDMLSSLAGSLCRLRKERIAFTCDIASMFMMVKITPEHREYTRILWWENGDTSTTPIEYHTCYHLFGAVSSPSICIRALQQTAIDHEDKYPEEVVDFVLNNFYMDDGTTSIDKLEDAINLAWGAIRLCSDGGFTLGKFTSNSKELLRTLPPDKRTPDLNETFDFEYDQLPRQRTLGMIWNTEEDLLQYQTDLPNQPLTRRGCLSTLSTIFDPLGLISPVLLPGRAVLQEACRIRLEWDDPLPTNLSESWIEWQNNLTGLETLQIARCLKPDEFDDIISTELHLFCDASTTGYGGAAYLRQTDISNNISVSLLMGKSRVVPIKSITVPRLELTSAVTMVRVARLLEKELRIPTLVQHFWTDSTCVLGYIQNEARRFKTFVAHRIQCILDYTDISQWHHVSTKSNPADIASRGTKPADLSTSIWFTGPNFLHQNVEFWNHKTDLSFEIPQEDTEIKANSKVFAVNVDIIDTSNRLILDRLETIGSWYKTKKTVSVWLHLIKIYKSRHQGVQVNPEYNNNMTERLEEAEAEIVRLIQSESFSYEVEVLTKVTDKSNRPVLKSSSSLIQLNPFADKNGLLRIGGRVKHSTLSYDEKHPIIIPKRGRLIQLIIEHYHQRQAHSGRNITLNSIRDKYWLINGPSTVRHYISKCLICTKLRGRPIPQMMNNLPDDRVIESPPFTYSACDLFGPFYIKVRRSEVKRYGLIFSCQSSRAVHIEILQTMTTDSFICGLRRFICRRGKVRVIRSDRGSQIIGAATELDNLKAELHQSLIKEDILKQFDCEIVFQPSVPYAPHFHGSWERQIQSIRRVFEALLHQHGKQLNDESLATLMVEAEAIINARPLTVESIADPELKPLAPANILTMKSGIVLPPPGVFTREDLYLHRQWRKAQYIANDFWSRWKKEILQLNQPRQKWQKPVRNLMVGDVVILVEENTPRNTWPLMIVENVYPSQDGLVRKVDIATTKGDIKLKQNDAANKRKRVVYTRAVNQLVLLLPTDFKPDEH